MKIHILTGVSYPELHPRAFRAYELAKEFALQGDEVHVSVLTRVEEFDYEKLEKDCNIHIHLLDLYKRKKGEDGNQIVKSGQNGITHSAFRYYRLALEYFLSGRLFFYAPKIAQQILIDEDTDMFISLSTPFMDILAGAIYRRKHPLPHTCFIADSGDPFSGSEQYKHAFYMQNIERETYKEYNYITIPVETAKNAYLKVVEEDKIKIIPQGFNFADTPIARYKKNDILTFAYAGVFYQDIRNPEFLLQYLCEKQSAFRFLVFLRHRDVDIDQMIDKYKSKLGERLEVRYGVERKELIYELSKCDFLVNVGNNNTTQLPSKLIDYGITKRPVIHCTKDNFDEKEFERFMQLDFADVGPIDIEEYNIKHITRKFKELTIRKL